MPDTLQVNQHRIKILVDWLSFGVTYIVRQKKKKILVYSSGTETTRRKRMGPRKGCNGSTTMPFERTSMKPSTASSRAAARVGSINERQAFTIRRGISLGQAVLPLALCFNKFKMLSRNNWCWSSLVRCDRFDCLALPELLLPLPWSSLSRFRFTVDAHWCTEDGWTRPLVSLKCTPSLISMDRFRWTSGEAAPHVPLKPPNERSLEITRCQGIEEQGYGFLLIAPPTARAQEPISWATAPYVDTFPGGIWRTQAYTRSWKGVVLMGFLASRCSNASSVSSFTWVATGHLVLFVLWHECLLLVSNVCTLFGLPNTVHFKP